MPMYHCPCSVQMCCYFSGRLHWLPHTSHHHPALHMGPLHHHIGHRGLPDNQSNVVRSHETHSNQATVEDLHHRSNALCCAWPCLGVLFHQLISHPRVQMGGAGRGHCGCACLLPRSGHFCASVSCCAGDLTAMEGVALLHLFGGEDGRHERRADQLFFLFLLLRGLAAGCRRSH